MLEALKKLFRPRWAYRSAVTGEYVSKAYAKAFPERTVRERVE